LALALVAGTAEARDDSTSDAPGAVRAGDPAPDFALQDEGGEELRLGDFAGRVLVLNFWASWCGPCKEELPLLDALHDRLSERGVVVLGINLDAHRRPARAVIRHRKVDLPTVFDPEGRAVSAYDPPSLPTTVVVDRKGVVRAIHNRSFDRRSITELEAALMELAGEP
jgi:peroxiredoxin